MADDKGSRSFCHTLGQLEDGGFNADLSTRVQALFGILEQHAEHFDKATGEIDIKVKVNVDKLGQVELRAEFKIKEPKVVRPRSIFWLNKNNQLENENPRQTKLALRDVGARPPARDVEDRKNA